MQNGEEIDPDEIADNYIRWNCEHYYHIGDCYGRQEFNRTIRLDKEHLIKLILDIIDKLQN